MTLWWASPAVRPRSPASTRNPEEDGPIRAIRRRIARDGYRSRYSRAESAPQTTMSAGTRSPATSTPPTRPASRPAPARPAPCPAGPVQLRGGLPVGRQDLGHRGPGVHHHAQIGQQPGQRVPQPGQPAVHIPGPPGVLQVRDASHRRGRLVRVRTRVGRVPAGVLDQAGVGEEAAGQPGQRLPGGAGEQVGQAGLAAGEPGQVQRAGQERALTRRPAPLAPTRSSAARPGPAPARSAPPRRPSPRDRCARRGRCRRGSDTGTPDRPRSG